MTRYFDNCGSRGGKYRERQEGFTLVEVLLVIFMIGLLAGLSGVGYSGAMQKMRIESAAKHLAMTVKYARIAAVEKQKRFLIKLDEENRIFYLVDEGNEDRPVRDLYCKPVKLDSNVEFEQIRIEPLGTERPLSEAAGKAISFGPDGTAQTAVVQFGNGESHMTVMVDAATARAKVYEGKAEEAKIRTIDLDDQWN